MSYVVVRVWVSRVKATSPGHASLAIFPNSRRVENGYISFAPIKSGSIRGPGRFYPFEHDYHHYIRPKGDRARGCWIGHIHGLDQQKMLNHLKHVNKHQTYSPSNECATQVHRYLQIGGGDKLASWWTRWALVLWSPDDVEDYARSIVEGTRHLGSRQHRFVGAGTVF
jgi:hypothetical protein